MYITYVYVYIYIYVSQWIYMFCVLVVPQPQTLQTSARACALASLLGPPELLPGASRCFQASWIYIYIYKSMYVSK